MRRTVLATVLLIPFASAAVGALNLISVNDEIALGRRAQQEVRQQVPELRDRTVSAYIENLGRRIAARADGPRFPYTFDVANSREVNAFALPGGPIWINRGTIDAAQTEAQLAGVIAHEIAHIANRHAAEQITKGTFANVGLGILGAILGGEGRASQIAHLGAGIAAQATMMKFSRDAEREADTKALQYMRLRRDVLLIASRARGSDQSAAAAGEPPGWRPPHLDELSAGASETGSDGPVGQVRQVGPYSKRLSQFSNTMNRRRRSACATLTRNRCPSGATAYCARVPSAAK
jgi:Zn-dependent protease with chaperone function